MSEPRPLDIEAAEDRLDELGEDIEKTKRQVEKDFGPDPEEQHYEDSGSEGQDDQTIAP